MVNPDWMNLLVDQVNALITANGGVLVHEGLVLTAYICVLKLLFMVGHWLWRAVDFAPLYHPIFAEVVIFLFQVSFVVFVLNHWVVPVPGSALSFHQWPTEIARQLTNTFDHAAVNQFLGYVQNTILNTHQPHAWEWVDNVIYMGILLNMSVIAAVMFVMTSYSFIGIGLCTVLGPLFIPWVLTKHCYAWFWTWLQSFIAFSMYRVVAAAIGWIWAQMYIYFFVHGVGTDYSIANWIALLPVVMMMNFGFIFSMFMIPRITSDWFHGAGSIGQSYVSAAGGAMRAALAMV